MTSAIPVQFSTNWAVTPNGNWTRCEFVIYPWMVKGQVSTKCKVIYVGFITIINLFLYEDPLQGLGGPLFSLPGFVKLLNGAIWHDRPCVRGFGSNLRNRYAREVNLMYSIEKFITWRGNSALNCTWKPISHESGSDECDIGFQVQFNAEFTSQVMNFSWIA